MLLRLVYLLPTSNLVHIDSIGFWKLEKLVAKIRWDFYNIAYLRIQLALQYLLAVVMTLSLTSRIIHNVAYKVVTSHSRYLINVWGLYHKHWMGRNLSQLYRYPCFYIINWLLIQNLHLFLVFLLKLEKIPKIWFSSIPRVFIPNQ